MNNQELIEAFRKIAREERESWEAARPKREAEEQVQAALLALDTLWQALLRQPGIDDWEELVEDHETVKQALECRG